MEEGEQGLMAAGSGQTEFPLVLVDKRPDVAEQICLSVTRQSGRLYPLWHADWKVSLLQHELSGWPFPLLLHQHYSWAVSCQGEMLHLLDALHLLEAGRQESAPVEGRDENISCLIADELGSVGSGGPVNELCYVGHAGHFRSSQSQLDEAETPVGRELGVAR